MRLNVFLAISISFQVVFANLALSKGVNGTGATISANTLEHENLKFSLGSFYSWGQALGVRATDENERPSDLILSGTRMDLGFAVAYGVLPFLETSLYLPFYKDDINGVGSSGLGEAVLSAKFNYPPYAHSKVYELSYLLQLTLPTANNQTAGGYMRDPWAQTRAVDETGAYLYNGDAHQAATDWYPYGSNSVVVIMRLLNSINFKEIQGMLPMSVHFGAGLALSDRFHENAFLIHGGLEFWFTQQFALVYALHSSVNVSNANKHIPISSFPINHDIGATFEIPESGVQIDIGGRIISNNWIEKTQIRQNINGGVTDFYYYKSPEWGIYAGLNYQISYAEKDTDGDGLKDSWDRCPLEKEDLDGFEDEDGCPEDDNDKDGIKDGLDQCPNEAEDMDGFKDQDGCPELDNDMDGIPDAQDTCPMEIEDIDYFQDEDGCPDKDNDQDGIEDQFDQCKDVPEDKDGFEDKDGCPDKDNDKDGIPDELDKCPMVPEVLNGVKDGDGCPD